MVLIMLIVTISVNNIVLESIISKVFPEQMDINVIYRKHFFAYVDYHAKIRINWFVACTLCH